MPGCMPSSICRRYVPTHGIRNMRALIVEDGPYIAEAIRDGLRLEATAAAIASDGDTAFELLDINTCGITILDRDIPGPAGHEIARHIVASGTLIARRRGACNGTARRSRKPPNPHRRRAAQRRSKPQAQKAEPRPPMVLSPIGPSSRTHTPRPHQCHPLLALRPASRPVGLLSEPGGPARRAAHLASRYRPCGGVLGPSCWGGWRFGPPSEQCSEPVDQPGEDVPTRMIDR